MFLIKRDNIIIDIFEKREEAMQQAEPGDHVVDDVTGAVEIVPTASAQQTAPAPTAASAPTKTAVSDQDLPVLLFAVTLRRLLDMPEGTATSELLAEAVKVLQEIKPAVVAAQPAQNSGEPMPAAEAKPMQKVVIGGRTVIRRGE